MRKYWMSVAFLIVFSAISSSAQNKVENFYYSVKGRVEQNSGVKKVCVEYEIIGQKKEDCVAVKANSFSLRKDIIQPNSAKIRTDNAKIKPLKVFLGNTNFELKITDEINFVKKPQIQGEFEKLTVIDDIRPNYFALYGELGEKNDVQGLAKLSELFDSFKRTDLQIAYIYFKNNPQSPLSVYAFERFAFFQDDFSLLDNDFSGLPDWIKNSVTGKYISNKIEGAKAVAINKSAPIFSQTSADGKRIGLENFRGKYVLLDFWASWCAPCRKEHPEFIKIYQKYQAKNFEILSVSIDEDRNAWLNASKTDNIIWTNILDTKGTADEIAVKYGVQAIPANFLINPDGIIVGKNLKSEELKKRLADLFE